MKKIMLVIVCVLLLVIIIFSLQNNSIAWFDKDYNGAYYFDVDVFWCKNRTACIHEIGHGIDNSMGSISQSEGFAISLDYAVGYDNPDQYCRYCVNIMAEMYAKIFQDAKGIEENVPEYLRKYYNWDLAEQALEKYPQDKVYFGIIP